MRVTEVSEAGTVPFLKVANLADRPLLLLDGEQLVGAKQNRVLNTTVLVAAESELTIPVSCVEHGRWGYRRREMSPSDDDTAPDGRRSLWKIQEDFKLRLPLKLSLSELAALIMSRDLLGPAASLGPAIRSAFDKISRVLSRDALALIDRMRDTIGVRAIGSKLQAPSAAHVEMIQMALQEGRRLDMTYYALSRDEVNRRQVDPYYLTFFDGGFYLIGYCHWRKTERIFAVERIRELKLLTARFEVRPGFNAEEYLKDSWGIIQGELVTVKVIFSKSVARYIGDRLWHPSQKFRALSDGRVEVTLRVADTLEVRRWILGYGPDAEVMEPSTLRDTLSEQADTLARKLAPSRIGLARAPGERARPRDHASRAR